MNIITIVSIAILAVILIVGAIIAVKKFFALSKEQKEELIINWLTGAVVTAQKLIIEKTSEANKEKFNQVVNQFKKNAPWVYKLFIKFTGELNLEDLIEKALQQIKDTEF